MCHHVLSIKVIDLGLADLIIVNQITNVLKKTFTNRSRSTRNSKLIAIGLTYFSKLD